MLVGTISSHEEREVAKDTITNYAQEQNISYFECNVDNGNGIDEAFLALLDKIMEKFHHSTMGGQSHASDPIIVNELSPDLIPSVSNIIIANQMINVLVTLRGYCYVK